MLIIDLWHLLGNDETHSCQWAEIKSLIEAIYYDTIK